MPYSLYLHIPFCRHRCGYCDFNTYAGLDALVEPYVQALCREVGLAGLGAGERLQLHTIFFGGGTPSLLSVDQVQAILQAVETHFDCLPGMEITLEANPGTLSLDYLRGLHSLGVNRLSLGVQSANPGELRLLEREHSYLDVIQAVTWARQAGFENFNLDLIFGLPYQTLESWQHSLDLALGLQPPHFSLYALTLEHGTPLEKWAGRGLLSQPDPDLAADMYEWSSQRLEAAGYIQYEISNWAQPGPDGSPQLCRHNLQYWRNQPYLGLGAGAHGYAAGVRTANTLVPAAYIQRLKNGWQGAPQPFPRTPATASATQISEGDEIGETMMMGLRLVGEGIAEQAFALRFGQSLEEHFAGPIKRFLGLGLLEWSGEKPQRRLRLTRAGRLLGNQVFMEFLE